MISKSNSEALSEKITEFRSLMTSYARQEVQDPLSALIKWTLLGLLGAAFILVGILITSIGLLRLLQDKATVFNDEFSFVPYCLSALFLITLGTLFMKSSRKHK
ncbi:MAG TPA: hypothetical protein QF431_00585, partial [Acidimicrobiales bacterium]|jgi:hypothetical protein|nr:hypothetical protein [Acidimicrobiales bacterium]